LEIKINSPILKKIATSKTVFTINQKQTQRFDENIVFVNMQAVLSVNAFPNKNFKL